MESFPHPETVILIHGLARTHRSMSKLSRMLRAHEFMTVLLKYPSRKYNLETLSRQYIVPEVNAVLYAAHGPVHFVTHSMGGILLRMALPYVATENIGRIVMLAPPNHGSEIVDTMRKFKWFRSFFGPAAINLASTNHVYLEKLPPLPDHCGIISGDRSAFHLFDNALPRPHDGTVSVASTKMNGAHAHIVLHTSHPFIMRSGKVIEETIYFLKNGVFSDFQEVEAK